MIFKYVRTGSLVLMLIFIILQQILIKTHEETEKELIAANTKLRSSSQRLMAVCGIK